MDYHPATLETMALDQIHALLSKAENRTEGLTTARIAHSIGNVAIGYIDKILKGSTCVIKRKGLKWVLDWSDLNDWRLWQLRRDYLLSSFVIKEGKLLRIGLDGIVVSTPFKTFRSTKARN